MKRMAKTVRTARTPEIMGVAQAGQYRRRSRERKFLAAMAAVWCALALFLLIYGDQVYSVPIVARVILGEEVKGASYAVRTIRIPRVLVGTLAGFSFGVAGNTFQKILRNSLASPDVMGITSGASAAAVFAMMVLGLSGAAVSGLAMAGGVGQATAASPG